MSDPVCCSPWGFDPDPDPDPDHLPSPSPALRSPTHPKLTRRYRYQRAAV